jgi:hypothetical protein
VAIALYALVIYVRVAAERRSTDVASVAAEIASRVGIAFGEAPG